MTGIRRRLTRHDKSRLFDYGKLMEGIMKFVLCLVVASGTLSAQFGDCTPLILGSGCTFNTPSLVIHAVISPHLGVAGNCPEGPCVVKYRVELDVWKCSQHIA